MRGLRHDLVYPVGHHRVPESGGHHTVGTAGCGRLAIPQAAIPFVYGNYGDQNGVASGLSRGLRIRFGDQPKDVVVMAGDGDTADIGYSCRCSIPGSGRKSSRRSCWITRCMAIRADKKVG